MNQTAISEHHKHLGLTFSNNGKWNEHIQNIAAKAWQRIIIRKFKFILHRQILNNMYIAYVRPILEYCGVIWDNCTEAEKQKLEAIQLESARIVTRATQMCNTNTLYLTN